GRDRVADVRADKQRVVTQMTLESPVDIGSGAERQEMRDLDVMQFQPSQGQGLYEVLRFGRSGTDDDMRSAPDPPDCLLRGLHPTRIGLTLAHSITPRSPLASVRSILSFRGLPRYIRAVTIP